MLLRQSRVSNVARQEVFCNFGEVENHKNRVLIGAIEPIQPDGRRKGEPQGPTTETHLGLSQQESAN